MPPALAVGRDGHRCGGLLDHSLVLDVLTHYFKGCSADGCDEVGVDPQGGVGEREQPAVISDIYLPIAAYEQVSVHVLKAVNRVATPTTTVHASYCPVCPSGQHIDCFAIQGYGSIRQRFISVRWKWFWLVCLLRTVGKNAGRKGNCYKCQDSAPKENRKDMGSGFSNAHKWVRNEKHHVAILQKVSQISHRPGVPFPSLWAQRRRHVIEKQ